DPACLLDDFAQDIPTLPPLVSITPFQPLEIGALPQLTSPKPIIPLNTPSSSPPSSPMPRSKKKKSNPPIV
ncbi:hypothetical protein HMI56_004525, partial [Coelomomyces lativittatus]